MPSPTAFLREFRDGETVHLAINGSVHAGMPDPKFQGRTGRVVRKQGASYLVAVRDGPHTTKTLVVNPVHLKRA
jgi:large subunit ribosomal protein L21e